MERPEQPRLKPTSQEPDAEDRQSAKFCKPASSPDVMAVPHDPRNQQFVGRVGRNGVAWGRRAGCASKFEQAKTVVVPLTPTTIGYGMERAGDKRCLLGFSRIPNEKKSVAGEGRDVGTVLVSNLKQLREAII